MQNINCIIIDADPQSIDYLESLIEKIDFLNLQGTYTNAYEAYSAIKTQPLDLIFIDVALEDIDGIELLETLKEKPHVIILSKTADYALKGYEFHIEDYLLKPVSYKRFLKAVNVVYDKMNEDHAPYPQSYQVPIQQRKNYIFIRTKYRMQKVSFDDILYIQGLSNYLIIKTKDDSIFTLQSFDELMKNLPLENFIRIHRSYAISIDKIESFHKNTVEISGNHQIPIGESYKQVFYEHLKKLNLFC
ncbi:MAG: LytR/AlgR family response regulator transcription factor [Bacteroidales bacterium]